MEFTRRQALKIGGIGLTTLAIPTLMTACNGTTVAQDIVNWVPALQSTAATVAALISDLDPALSGFIAGILAGFNAGATLVVAQAKAYLANPTTGVLGTLSQAVVTFQQTVNAAILSAARIVNAGSQQLALAALNGVATVINAIIALIGTVKGNTLTTALAQVKSKVTLAQIQPYVDKQLAADMLSYHYGHKVWPNEVTMLTANLQTMGF